MSNNASEYLSVNKALWNGKTPHHIASEFYDMPSFVAGKSSLTEVELGLLGDVKGKSILHLQCHFGKDTLSLARMGAKVTGIDLSDVAVAKAQELNEQLGLDAEFICTDLYSLPDVLDKKYDVVYTSYGTICWLPDMDKWAGVISQFIKPGGAFVFVDFHPVLWMFDDDFSGVKYSYFNTGAIVDTPEGTYADFKADIRMEEIVWNHGQAEVIQALLNKQLQMVSLAEYNESPYPCFKDITEVRPGYYQIKGFEGKLPMVYALKMIRA